MRKQPLVTDQVYHVFNRGVNKNDIFYADDDYRQFLDAAIHYITRLDRFSWEKRARRKAFSANHDPLAAARQAGSIQPPIQLIQESPPKVEILAYCLMPNHFHFLVKQLEENGLTAYFQRLSSSFAHYVNIKHDRVGPLFQGRFKGNLIETDEQLIHVCRYIHLNPLVSGVVADLNTYPWSSYLAYIRDQKDKLCNPKLVLDLFISKESYEKFVLDQADYGRELERIKHLTHDHK